MKKLAYRIISPLVLLACSLLTGGALQASIINLSSISGPMTFGAATPGMYTFGDFGVDAAASLVTATLTGTASDDLTLVMGGSPDYVATFTGDRLLLGLTNNSGSALTGIQFNLSNTTFNLVDDPIDPSRGTFSSNTYISLTDQRLNSPNVSATDSQVNFTFDTILADGATTAFYLPLLQIGGVGNINAEAGNNLFTLSVTPLASDVPEPTTLGLVAAVLVGLGLVKRRKS